MNHGRAGALHQHFRKLVAEQSTGHSSDRELLQRFAQHRDEAAFTTLVRRHGPMVLRVCQRMLHNEHDAEDVTQATFLVLASKADSSSWQKSVAGWLHRVAYHLTLKAHAATAQRRVQEHRVVDNLVMDPLESITGRELRAALDEELSRLPEKYRAPLVLCYLEGSTRDEAASQLGCPLGTLKSRVERGRELLRKRLAARGLTFSTAVCTALLTQGAAEAGLSVQFIQQTIETALFLPENLMKAGGMGSLPALELARGMLKTMLLNKLNIAAAYIAGLCVLAAGVSLAMPWAAPAEQRHATLDEQPPALSSRERPQSRAEQQRTDLHGDPLPTGVLARLGTTRLRHATLVNSVAFAPDGQTLASVSLDGALHVWNVADGKETLSIETNDPNHPRPFGLEAMLAVAFTSEGKTVAATSMNHPIRLWDVATGKLLRRFDREQNGRWLTVSADGRTLAYNGLPYHQEDGTIRLADVETGKDLLRLKGPEAKDVRCAAFSPDGKILATGSGAKAVRLWDLATGAEFRALEGHPNGVRSLVFSPNGKTVISGGCDQTIRLWEVATGKELRKLMIEETGRRGPFLALTRDGKLLVSGHGSMVRIWDMATGLTIHRFPATQHDLGSLALSPDGKTLATVIGSVIRLWEVPSGKPLLRELGSLEGFQWELSDLKFSPDGLTLATGGSQNRLWETATGRELHSFPTEGPIAITPDGKTLIGAGYSDGKLHLCDLATGQERRTFPCHTTSLCSLAVAPDGKTLASLGYKENVVHLWDLTTGREIHNFGGKQRTETTKMAFTAGGKFLVTLHREESVVGIWDVATGKELRRLNGHQECLESMAISPDGRTVASGCTQGTLYLWEIATGHELWHGKIGSRLGALAFAPDSHTLAWGGASENAIHLWEVRTHKERCQFRGHRGPVTSLAFSEDNSRLASTSDDGTALVWDLTGTAGLDKDQVAKLAPKEIESLWSDLGEEAAKAHTAMVHLWKSPEQAVRLLQTHLFPSPQANAKQMIGLIGELDSIQFAERERATKELTQHGDAAEPAMRQALENKPTAEVRQRLRHLLAGLEPSQLRATRAVEVLERLGTAEARRLLTALAQGAPESRLTGEAQAAVDRLAKRPSAKR